jgi:type IV conjugative transfer system coupling protein TraD
MAEDSPHLVDDISRGVGLFHLRLRTQIQSIIRVILMSGILFLAIPTLMLWFGVQPHEVGGAFWWKVASLFAENGAGSHILHPLGDQRNWSAEAIATDPWFAAQAEDFERIWLNGLLYAFLGTPFIVGTVIFLARAVGRKARQPIHLRGRRLVSDSELAGQIIRAGQASDLAIGNVPLVAGSETQHILMAGTTGAGKTQAIYRLLDAVRARGDMAIVYDLGGSFIPAFYRPELGDQILNPLDRRSATWSPWAEMTSIASEDRIAAAIIPSSKGNNQIFSDGARAIVSTALRLLKNRPNRSVLELFRILVVNTRAEKEKMFSSTELAQFFERDAGVSAASVGLNATAYIRCFRFLKAKAGLGDFSLTRFVQSADAAIGSIAPRPWVFISSNREQHEALQPLITCLMDSAVAAALSLPKNLERRIWLFVDEMDSLQEMPSLRKALTEGRGKGVCVVGGLQDFSQLFANWGHERGESILGLFNTLGLFKLLGETSAKYASFMLGEAEQEQTEESARYGANKGFESLNLGTRREVKPLVLPTQFTELPNLSGYVRVTGGYPIALTHLPNPALNVRPELHAGYEEADLSDTITEQLGLTFDGPVVRVPDLEGATVTPEPTSSLAQELTSKEPPPTAPQRQRLVTSPANDATETMVH